METKDLIDTHLRDSYGGKIYVGDTILSYYHDGDEYDYRSIKVTEDLDDDERFYQSLREKTGMFTNISEYRRLIKEKYGITREDGYGPK